MEAALQIGLYSASVRKIAELLGVSVQGVYHHVRTSEELLDLVVKHSFSQILDRIPSNQTYHQYLTKYAEDTYVFISNHPQLITSVYMGRGLFTRRSLRDFAGVIERGIASGLTGSEAFEVFVHITSAVIGAAATKSADRSSETSKTPLLAAIAEHNEAQHDGDPLLALLANAARNCIGLDHFEAVRMAMNGLAMKFRFAPAPPDSNG